MSNLRIILINYYKASVWRIKKIFNFDHIYLNVWTLSKYTKNLNHAIRFALLFVHKFCLPEVEMSTIRRQWLMEGKWHYSSCRILQWNWWILKAYAYPFVVFRNLNVMLWKATNEPYLERSPVDRLGSAFVSGTCCCWWAAAAVVLVILLGDFNTSSWPEMLSTPVQNCPFSPSH